MQWDDRSRPRARLRGHHGRGGGRTRRPPEHRLQAPLRRTEECVLAIIDAETDRFITAVFSAYEQHQLWRDGMRAAAYAAARFVRDNTRYIRFSTVMMNGATDLARTRRDMSFQLFAEIIDGGRQELDDPDSVSPETALTVIGSIVQLIFREVGRHGETADAESFVPELMYQAVRPYLGHAEALKELSIPAPPEGPPPPTSDPRS